MILSRPPNSCFSDTIRLSEALYGILLSVERVLIVILRGLGAAAPSGAGESGWFGGRKPPLPSRGGSSLQIKVTPLSSGKDAARVLLCENCPFLKLPSLPYPPPYSRRVYCPLETAKSMCLRCVAVHVFPLEASSSPEHPKFLRSLCEHKNCKQRIAPRLGQSNFPNKFTLLYPRSLSK